MPHHILITFQFQYGSIKSPFCSVFVYYAWLFQFQYGSIKSGLSLKAVEHIL